MYSSIHSMKFMLYDLDVGPVTVKCNGVLKFIIFFFITNHMTRNSWYMI